MSYGPANNTRRRRTFTGCWRCRSRKVRCDLKAPSCSQCARQGQNCPGYSIDLIWVGSDGHGYTPGRRRIIDPGTTWAGKRIFSERELLSVIDSVEMEDHRNRAYELRRSPFGVYRVLGGATGLTRYVPSEATDLTVSEFELMHHFIDVIAELMMPGKDVPNPWKTLYPRLARARANTSHLALFNAMMAHSAIHKINLTGCTPGYQAKYCYHHAESLLNISRTLRSSRIDYGSLLGSMRTLMMLDVYGSPTGAWRHHLLAARTILSQRFQDRAVQISDDEWTIIQSLCLSQLRESTMSVPEPIQQPPEYVNRQQDEYRLLRRIATRPKFGFSIGVPGHLLVGMASIQYLHNTTYAVDFVKELETAGFQAENIEFGIEACSARMFQLALLIYTKHLLTVTLPRDVQSYVSGIFAALSDFVRLGGREPTVWPLFVGAVEACQIQHQAQARAWLNRGAERGIKSRLQVLELLETIWSRRSQVAEYTGVSLDLVAVDWRAVVREKQLDLPLAS